MARRRDREEGEEFEREDCGRKKRGYGPHSGSVYGLGLIGALVYFIQHSVGFWGAVVAILKALVWPAFLVYQLFVMAGK